eukprot:5064882-Pyramimonas_sp.AAC.1
MSIAFSQGLESRGYVTRSFAGGQLLSHNRSLGLATVGAASRRTAQSGGSSPRAVHIACLRACRIVAGHSQQTMTLTSGRSLRAAFHRSGTAKKCTA